MDKRADEVRAEIHDVRADVREVRKEIQGVRIFKLSRLGLAVTALVGTAVIGTFILQLLAAIL